jgi:hypothetical protein
MDVLALLRRAHKAGLRVEPAGDKLTVRGPKHAEPVVKLLAEHKVAVLAALSNTTHDAELLSPAPWFNRAIPPAEGEPGIEMPFAARRGRLQELEGMLLHFCAECGAWSAYGSSVNLRTGRMGTWYCTAHRPQKHRQ